jgi:hypothetical protein
MARRRQEIRSLAERFRQDAESFYGADALRNGCITTTDRDGSIRSFPLLTVSSEVLELAASAQGMHSPEEVSNIMARLKKGAKRSGDKIASARLQDFCRERPPPFERSSTPRHQSRWMAVSERLDRSPFSRLMWA